MAVLCGHGIGDDDNDDDDDGILLGSENQDHNYTGKGKGNVRLYSASSRTPVTRSDMVHTVLPANNTIYAFTLSIPQAAPPRIYA